jgi:hypothetical protein
MTVEQLTLAGGLAAAVAALWKVVLDYIKDLRTDRDAWRTIALEAHTEIPSLAIGLRKVIEKTT